MSDESPQRGHGKRAPDRRAALPIPEVAAMLGVSPVTVHRAVASGEFPHVPVRSKKQIPRKFVEELLDSPKYGTSGEGEVVA